MSEMGKAMMGTGEAEGERRALDAAEAAIANPLLEDTSMKGARGVLINITGSDDITLFEVDEAATRIRSEVDDEAHIIVGSAFDPSLEGVMRVSVVATGIDVDASRAPAPITLNVSDEPRRYSVPEIKTEEPVQPVEVTAPSVAEAFPETSTPAPVSEELSEEKHAPSALEQIVEAAEIAAAEEAKNLSAADHDDVAAHATEEQLETVAESIEAIEPEKTVEPVEPVVAAPAMGATDAFIPPKPATSTRPKEAAAPDPFRAADMANGGGEKKSEPAVQTEERRPSLFERVTRSGRAAFDRVGGVDAAQAADISNKNSTEEAEMVAPLKPASGMAPPPMRAVSAQAEMAGLAPAPVQHEQEEAEADDLDIPAFLRRQAN